MAVMESLQDRCQLGEGLKFLGVDHDHFRVRCGDKCLTMGVVKQC